jgi:DNA-binding PadR family transcriptional regulator
MEFSSRSIFGGYVETELLRQMNERIVKNFLDILILIELRRGSLSDSELATGLLGKVGEVADPHLVESNLSFLTKEGFITNRSVENQKLYALTDQGKEKVKAVLDSKNKLLGLFLNLFI